jgi:hypothetical protein
MSSWLPDTLIINRNWKEAWDELYDVFKATLIDAQPQLRGYPVWIDKKKDENGYEETFWHLISQHDRQVKDRIPDFPRARKLPWCAATICNSEDPAVKCWTYLEGKGRVRIYLWIEEHDYVVILEPAIMHAGTIFHLVTAFEPDGPSTKRNLRRKYENRLP